MFKHLIAAFIFLLCHGLTLSSKYVNITDFTYHVSVRRTGRHVCSGALVQDSWIITAASCVYDSSVPKLSVLLGSSDLENYPTKTGSITTGRVYEIAKFVLYRTFDKILMTNNIAMLKTRHSVIGQDYPNIRPIFLPSSENYHLKDGSLLVVSGWKRLPKEAAGCFESQLSVTRAPLVNQRACIRSMPSYKAVSARKMLCAGYIDPNTNETCQGDIGAPLANHDVLVGILSSGDECNGSSARPAVYTRVGSFLPWITKIIELDRSPCYD